MPLSFVLQANDPDLDPLTYSVISQPENGVISGIAPNVIYTPNTDSNGPDQFTFQVNDGELNSNIATITINIAAINDAPVAQEQSLNTAEDNALNITLTGADQENNLLTFVLDAQPASGVLSGSGANITYTPNANYSGNDSFSYHVNDGEFDSTIVIISISVNAINDSPIANAQSVTTNEDSIVNVTLSGSDPENNPLTFVIDSQPENGQLSGIAPNLVYTPNENIFGSDAFTFHVNDGSLDSNIVTVPITINTVNDAPEFQFSPGLSATENSVYTATVTATDSDGDLLTYILESAPDGMTIDSSTGVIQWLPSYSQSGDYLIAVAVSDGNGGGDSENFTLTVANANRAPTISSTAVGSVIDGDIYLYAVVASDEDDEDSLSYVLSTSPSAMIIDSVSGLVQWSSPIVGEHAVGIVVSDGDIEVTQNFTLTVNEANEAPVITSIPVHAAIEGESYKYSLTAEDPNGDALSYRLITAPAGVTFDSIDSSINWASPVLGSYPISVEVSDPEGLFAQQSYTIQVVSELPQQTTKGQDFWAMFNANTSTNEYVGILPKLSLFIVSETDTEVNIEIPGLSFSQVYLVSANQVEEIDLYDAMASNTAPYLSFVDQLGIGVHGIHVTALADINLYLIHESYISTDSTQIFPTSSLDLEYLVFGDAKSVGIVPSSGEFHVGNFVGVVATEDNTLVEITPLVDLFIDDSGTTIAAGETHRVTLNAGETFQGLGPKWRSFLDNKDSDLSGSSVVADKPVAVFSGDKCVALGGEFACDHVVEQIPPISSWGLSYMTMPLAARAKGDLFKVVSAHDNTHVWINHVLVANLQKGEYHTVILDEPSVIEGSRPIAITQFSHSNDYDASHEDRDLPTDFGDPFMVLISPKEQFLPAYTFATPSDRISINFINLIANAADVESLRLDGSTLGIVEWEIIPGTDYMGAQLAVTAGQHSLTADSPFGLTIYGFDWYVSYGHMGGQGLVDLSSASELIVSATEFNPNVGDSVCLNTQLLDSAQTPISQTQIFFEREYNGFQRFYTQITDVAGHASFCYEAEAEGLETVSVSAQHLSATLIINWQPPFDTSARAPQFFTLPVMSATPGGSYRYQALARDANNDILTYSLVTGPAGMSIDAATGLVQWTVSRNFDNTPISIAVSDGFYSVVQQYPLVYTQRSNRYPDFTSVPITRTFSDREYLYRLTAVDPDNVIHNVIYSLISAPSGMALENAALVWLPESADVGDHAVEVQITDLGGFTTLQSFTLTVDLNQAPVFISNPPSLEVTVGHDWIYTFAIDDNEYEGGLHPYSYSLIDGPEGMSVNHTGYARWFPGSSQIGSHAVELEVQDPSGAVGRQQFNVTVLPNGVPEFTTLPAQEAVARHLYNSPIVAVDTDGDQLIYSVNFGPEGLSTYGASVRWTPREDQVGTHSVSITAADRFGASATITYSLDVKPNNAPVFTTVPVENVIADRSYSYSAAALDAEGDSISYRLVTGPIGMAISSWSLSWTPSASQVGSHLVVIEANDSLGGVSEQRYTLNVNPDRAPVFSSVPANVAYVGINYSDSAQASDPDGDQVLFRKISGPSNLNVSVYGPITWTPSADFEGRHTVVIEAYDYARPSVSTTRQSFDITVIGDNLLIVEYPLNPLLNHAQAWQGVVTAVNPDELPITYSLVFPVPAGLNIEPSTGVLTWTPSFAQIGSHSITVTAADGEGQEDSVTFSLTVQEGENQTPVVDSEAIIMAYTGEIYEYPLQVSDPENQSLIYALLLGPDAMSIDSEGVLVWLPEVNDVGIHAVTISITDSEGAETLHSFDLSVSQERDYPLVTSEPITEARTEDGYSYQIQARDPEGDPLNYSVIDAPSSLVIDSSGLVTWSPILSDVGESSVIFGISDDNGFVTEHQYEIQVTAPGPHNRRICR